MSLAASALGSLGNFGRHLGPRSRKVIRYIGFALLGVITFVFAFQLTFPFDRVRDRIVDLAAEKYEISVGDVERGIIPGRVYFKAVTMRTRPTKAGEVATTFYLDQLEVDVGLLALLHSTIAVKLDAKIGPGHIKADVALNNDHTSIHATGEDLPSGSLPVREALGLPMSGKVRFTVDLDVPNDKTKGGKPNLARADGGLEFACPSGCSVGDGKTKLKLTTNNARQQAFLDEGGGGIDFGKVNIDSLFATVEIKSGRLEITRFDAKSSDGDLKVALNIALNQDLQSSLVTGCLRFHGSDALLKREPKTHAAISTTGAPLGPDGLFHIKLDGQIRQVRRIGQVCGPGASGSDSPGAPPLRPNLTITPDAPRPPGPGIVANPPPPPPPAQAPTPTPMPTPPPQVGPGMGDTLHNQPLAPAGEAPPPVVYPSTGSGVVPSSMPQPAQGSGFAPQPVPPGGGNSPQ